MAKKIVDGEVYLATPDEIGKLVEISEEQIRQDIENIVASACDGTWDGLERATFVYNASPRDLVNRILNYIDKLVVKNGEEN